MDFLKKNQILIIYILKKGLKDNSIYYMVCGGQFSIIRFLLKNHINIYKIKQYKE
jgi:hypothetical protein